MGLNGDRRPGAWSTHRGKAVVAGMVLALVACWALLVVSNKLGGSGSAAAADSADPLVDVTTSTGADGAVSTETPSQAVVPAVPDPFQPGSDANAGGDGSDLLGGGPTSPSSTSAAVDPSTSDTVTKLSRDVTASYCAWSWKNSAQAYVDSIHSLTPAYRKNLLSSVEESWPEVQRSKESATCKPSSEDDATVSSFDAKSKTVVVTVRVVQTVNSSAVDHGIRTVSFAVTLVQHGHDWQVDHMHA